jgi:hypothetical protein
MDSTGSRVHSVSVVTNVRVPERQEVLLSKPEVSYQDGRVRTETSTPHIRHGVRENGGTPVDTCICTLCLCQSVLKGEFANRHTHTLPSASPCLPARV